jgi:hypothetical protein
MNKTIKKKSKFINSSEKRRITSLMRSSILRRIWLNFMAQYLVFSALVQFFYSPRNEVARGIMFLTRPSVCLSGRLSVSPVLVTASPL